MSSEERDKRRSKFLSFVLRHQPDAAGIELDASGWAKVKDLLAGCEKARRGMTRDELESLVATNAKKRFEFSSDGNFIRASQGHSVEVDLQYEPMAPPDVLYHGTATRFLDPIRAEGLRKMNRHHVHLSATTKPALEVGARYGKPVLLTIRAAAMHEAGHAFFRSTNGVWLVEHVPAEFIRYPEQ